LSLPGSNQVTVQLKETSKGKAKTTYRIKLKTTEN